MSIGGGGTKESRVAARKDKAPGSDGFPIMFYKKFWDVIKVDLMLVVQDYNKIRIFLDKGNNITFSSLIFKKEGA